MLSGMNLGQQMSAGRQWLLAIGLALAGGFLNLLVGISLASNTDVVALLGAIVLATSCLYAGWLLRSWWGLIAAPVAYIAAAAFVWALFIAGGGTFLTAEFGQYIVAPAVVMSIIGTAIGMYQAGRAGQRPHYDQPLA